jgi:putative membrane protein
MRIATSFAALAVGAGLIAAPAVATAGPDHAASHGTVTSNVPRVVPAPAFLTKAAAANQFEIVTGQLAQQRAQASAIKDLGAMFVTDHTALLQQGAQVAAQLNIPVTPTLSRKQQATVDKLQRLSGKAFDAAWLRAQLAAHEDALALNLAGAIRGENTAIRTLGQGALPVVTKHYGELLDLVEAGSAPGGHRHGHRGHGARS